MTTSSASTWDYIFSGAQRATTAASPSYGSSYWNDWFSIPAYTQRNRQYTIYTGSAGMRMFEDALKELVKEAEPDVDIY